MASRAKVKIINKFQPFFGRLIMKYKKGNTYARYVFQIKKLLENCLVKEILPCPYN